MTKVVSDEVANHIVSLYNAGYEKPHAIHKMLAQQGVGISETTIYRVLNRDCGRPLPLSVRPYQQRGEVTLGEQEGQGGLDDLYSFVDAETARVSELKDTLAQECEAYLQNLATIRDILQNRQFVNWTVNLALSIGQEIDSLRQANESARQEKDRIERELKTAQADARRLYEENNKLRHARLANDALAAANASEATLVPRP